jgi:hypothetical protein
MVLGNVIELDVRTEKKIPPIGQLMITGDGVQPIFPKQLIKGMVTYGTQIKKYAETTIDRVPSLLVILNSFTNEKRKNLY